jgi:Raf kinase inhibitor-like YbhB/YbcL family protein
MFKKQTITMAGISFRLRYLLAAAALTPLASAAVAAPTLTVTIQHLTKAGYLPLSAAFCEPKGTSAKPLDESPGLVWSAGPRGTKSYAIIMVDPDVTTNLSLMNKPGVIIAADSPRMNIYHWILLNIPADVTRLAPGADGIGWRPGGKPIAPAPIGTRGTNDYWPFFNKNPKLPARLKGPYAGYDGPCPPANDALVHDYKFEVFALDARLPLAGRFFAAQALAAMRGHVLAQGEADAKFTFTGS